MELLGLFLTVVLMLQPKVFAHELWNRVWPSETDTNSTTTMTTTQDTTSKNSLANYNWHVLSLSIFSITGAFGNILVCMTIRRDPALQTKTNYYLFSLAIADLAVCLMVIPLSIIQDFSDEWIFSHLLCTLWIASDILLCTSSIYHLSAVSILRFIAIQYPLKSNRTISTNQTFVVLATIWIISTLFSTIILYLGDTDLNNVMDVKTGRCGLRHEKFIIYGSIFSFVIPLLIMIVMFSLMVRKLRMQLKKLDKASPCITAQSRSAANSITSRPCELKKSASEGMKDNLVLKDPKSKKNVLIVFKKQNVQDRERPTTPGNSFKFIAPHSKSRHFMWKKQQLPSREVSSAVVLPSATAAANSKRKAFRATRSTSGFRAFNSSISSTTSTQIMCVANDEHAQARLSQLLVPHPSQPLLVPAACRKPSNYDCSSLRRSTPVGSRNSYAKNSFLGHLSRLKVQSEVKALRVLGIVFIAFIIAWLPFCLVNIISAIYSVQLDKTLNYLTYLGYFQSTFNPIIYTVFNKKFRRNFIEILKCKVKKNQGFQKKF